MGETPKPAGEVRGSLIFSANLKLTPPYKHFGTDIEAIIASANSFKSKRGPLVARLSRTSKMTRRSVYRGRTSVLWRSLVDVGKRNKEPATVLLRLV